MKSYKNRKPYDLFNLKALHEITGIGRDKMYKNMKGISKTLSDDEILQIETILNDARDDMIKTVKKGR